MSTARPDAIHFLALGSLTRYGRCAIPGRGNRHTVGQSNPSAPWMPALDRSLEAIGVSHPPGYNSHGDGVGLRGPRAAPASAVTAIVGEPEAKR